VWMSGGQVSLRESLLGFSFEGVDPHARDHAWHTASVSLCARESKTEKPSSLSVRFCSKLRRIMANLSRKMNRSADFPAIGLDLIL
jgi:hypothetical protein